VAPVLVTVEAPRTEKVVKSGPRIPSAFALDTEKDKIAKERITKEKTEKYPILRIFEYLCGGHDGSRQQKNLFNRGQLGLVYPRVFQVNI
jgi:hypothetical protein